MDDFERIQEREHRRNDFVSMLTGLIRDEEIHDVSGKKTMAVAVIYFCLTDLLRKGRARLNEKLACDGFAEQTAFLNSKILPRIMEFSPHVEEERSIIMASLLEWATETVAQDFYSDFLTVTQNRRPWFLDAVKGQQHIPYQPHGQ